jgi:hypothetical protein
MQHEPLLNLANLAHADSTTAWETANNIIKILNGAAATHTLKEVLFNTLTEKAKAQTANFAESYMIGICYYNGWGITQNYASAAQFFTQSLNQENSQGKELRDIMLICALFHEANNEYFLGNKKNYTAFCEKANTFLIEHKDTQSSPFMLECKYLLGLTYVLHNNIAKGVDLLEQAAMGGYGKALTILAKFYAPKPVIEGTPAPLYPSQLSLFKPDYNKLVALAVLANSCGDSSLLDELNNISQFQALIKYFKKMSTKENWKPTQPAEQKKDKDSSLAAVEPALESKMLYFVQIAEPVPAKQSPLQSGSAKKDQGTAELEERSPLISAPLPLAMFHPATSTVFSPSAMEFIQSSSQEVEAAQAERAPGCALNVTACTLI